MSDIITFEESGLDQVIAKLERMPLKMRLFLEKAVIKLALQYVNKVTTEKLAGQMVKRRTGNLASSVRLKQRLFTEHQTIAEMAMGGSNAPYGPDVEFGTRPHEIKAVNAKALRFEVGGNPIFRKKVNHPGTWPRPAMGSTLEEMRPWIELELANAVREGLQA